TSVLPGIDPRRPDRTDPALVRRVLEEERVTTLVASPSIVAKLLEPREPLRLRALFTGGAPVLPPLALAMVERIDGAAHVLYGSTEVEPVAAISARDYCAALADDGALGLCAGPPVPELELAIVAANDGPLTNVDP